MGDIGYIPSLILLLVLLCCSAFFSGSETALMSLSSLRLKHLEAAKPVRARLVSKMLKKPETLIGTILLGNNLVNVGMSALATALAISAWGEKGIVYVTAVLTLAILIFAEITPKIYAKYFNERVSLLIAPMINVFFIIFKPLVWAITYISGKILLLVGVDVSKVKRPLMTEGEIKTCIKMGWDDGIITPDERKLLSRVFTLNDKSVNEVMVPREEMVVINNDATFDEINKIVLKTGFSRFPVTEMYKSEIIGFIHTKDLFQIVEKKKPFKLKHIIRPPYFVPADRKIDAQLRSFQAEKAHQAVVLDNAGQVTGLVTLEDIIEELVGSIQDEHN